MSSASPPITDLSAALATERDALKVCVELLNAEQDALVQGRVDDLPQIAAQKSAMLNNAAHSTAAREAQLARCKLPATLTGMQALLASQPGLRSLWDEVLHWAKQARDLNRVSGCLIDARLGDNRQALAMLHQSSASATYGRDGHLQSRGAGRALAIG